ncbi:MAG: tripartite tricarboxylate transporter substrate-binding protein [Alphaproteobacteria bacterium]|nr:tripartite tricarboxylate transporter substrate-binding protein [Alphaproteobacteria bacterium]
MSKRWVAALAVGVITTVAAVAPAAAQMFPTRPVTVVVPFAAGGPTDVMARILGQRMSRTLGQSVVVENVTGAGGTIGVTRVSRSPADGYTLLVGHLGTQVANMALYRTVTYDADRDFEPIGTIGTNPQILVVRRTLEATTYADFITWLRANRERASFGSAGVGSMAHVAAILFFSQVTGTGGQHIPYRGTGPAMNDLVAGQFDFMFDQSVNAVPQIQAGTIKPLAITTARRFAVVPDVPTFAEVGLPVFELGVWNSLFAPRNTPQPVLERLHAAYLEAMADEAVSKRLADLGADVPTPDQRTREALRQRVRADMERWIPIIRAAGATVE